MELSTSVDTVGDLLRCKTHSGSASAVATVSVEATVLEAIRLMNDWGIGCVLVTRGEAIAGIFSERDVLRRVVGAGRPPDGTAVAEVMTADVVCCTPQMPVEQVGEIMRHRRIRHLPVIDADERTVGLVSIGDVNAYRFTRCEIALHQVEDYVFRRA